MIHGKQVKLMRTTNPALVHAPTTTVWAAPAKPKKQSVVSPVPATEPEIRAAGNNGVHESRSHHEEGTNLIFLILIHDHVLSEFLPLALHFYASSWHILLDPPGVPCSCESLHLYPRFAFECGGYPGCEGVQKIWTY